MTTPATFAFELSTPGNLEQWVFKLLAVAGGAAVGALLVGGLTQLLARLLTTRAVPRVPLLVVRLLGAVAFGWLVALFVFGHGGGGWGGPGGLGFGGGDGDGTGKAEQPGPTARATDTHRQDVPRDTGRAATDGRALRVELLDPGRIMGERYYRIEGETRARTRDEVRDAIRQGQQQSPPLAKLVAVIYTDSSKGSPLRELKALADDMGLTWAPEEPPNRKVP